VIAEPARVSVIIPTFNRCAILDRAVRSARGRIGPDDEIIVVDDGSTDGTAELLAEEHPEVRVVTTDHRGPGAARNAGIEVARGRFIAFLDSDDEWLESGLDEQVRALTDDPGLGLSYAAYRPVDREGDPVRAHPTRRPRRPRSGKVLKALLRRNFITTSTAVVPADVLKEVGVFAEDLDHSMDWDLWIRIAEKRRVHYLDRPVAVYRFHDDQQIRDREAVDECRSRILARTLERFEAEGHGLTRFVRRLLSYRLLRLGRVFLLNGDRAAAREQFRKAAKVRPLAKLTAARYVVTVWPKR
jgi:glycosyltransferase involved in cell wall biosynthesis